MSNETMPLYHEQNEVDESDKVAYNLMEDIRCLKADVERLQGEVERLEFLLMYAEVPACDWYAMALSFVAENFVPLWQFDDSNNHRHELIEERDKLRAEVERLRYIEGDNDRLRKHNGRLAAESLKLAAIEPALNEALELFGEIKKEFREYEKEHGDPPIPTGRTQRSIDALIERNKT